MKTRILSAIVLLSVIVPILILGNKYFSLAVAVIALFAYRELLNLKYNKDKIPILIQILGMIITTFLVLANSFYSFEFGLSYKGLIGVLLIFLLPTLYYKKENYNTKDAFYMIGITLSISLIFNSFILIRNFKSGLYVFIYLLIITVLTDTFAMFTGMLIGKHKLCPTISPKKSWEGSIGGSIIATASASFFYHKLINPINYKIIIITLLLSIIGQLGDLVFSRIKRDNDLKDYSNIIPGHGGILDRLDSIIFVVICYVLLHSFI